MGGRRGEEFPHHWSNLVTGRFACRTRDPGVIGTATGFLSRERTGPPRPRAGLTPAPARPIPIQRLSSECDVTSSFTPSCSYTATEVRTLAGWQDLNQQM